MIIINQTTANQMIEENNNLRLVNDIYGRTYLLGVLGEILVLPDESEIIQKIRELQNRLQGVTS